MKKKLSDYVWEYIGKLGIRHVFMFPGGGAMHLVDSLGKNPNLKNITLLHEQACAMAAETYARIDYGMGAVLVTTGPGGTNTLTGVAAAWLESTPMIVISGQAKTADLKGDSGVRQKGNQEIGIVDIVKSITKYAVMVTDPKKIKYHLDRAVYEAKTGRQGPVWLDIPLDIQAAMIEEEELISFEGEQINYHIDESVIKSVAKLLQKAERPILIAGQGIERRNGKEAFRKLVEQLRIPVLTSWIAVELLEFENEYNMGKPGTVAGRYSNFTMQTADLVIAIGTRLDPAMIGYNQNEFAPNAKKVIVDIDEYELNKFQFPVDIKIVADATYFVEDLYEYLKSGGTLPECNEWMERCREWKKKYPIMKVEFEKVEQGAVNPYYFIERLSNALADDDVIIPGSSGAGIDIFWLALKNKKNQRTLATGSLGSMGYGIPASIGACLASGRRTICVEGDGSLQLNIQELASVRGMNLPIKIFVNDNKGYLSIMNMQRTHFNAQFVGANEESGLYIPDIVAVAKAYGFKTYILDDQEKTDEIIEKVLKEEGPVLCDVHMKADTAIQPRVMSKVLPDGSMASGSLIDLWPFLDEKELMQEFE